MSAIGPEEPKTRPWVIVVGVLAILAGLGWCVSRVREQPSSLPMKDFVEYWSAAKVNLAGGNPYDAAQLKPHQQAALGVKQLDDVTMMWNPPWVLVLVTPLGLLSATSAHYVFLAVQLAAILLSATWLWKVYRGPTSYLWVAWVLALTFGPSAFVFWYGQIGGLLLLGLAGFLYFRHIDRPVIAGVFVALTAIKPHLLFAFGLVVVLDALVSRAGRRTLLAGFVTVLLAAGGAWLMNPAVYAHYSGAGWQSSTDINVSPKDWAQPLVSYWLRMALAPGAFWVQFLPMMSVVGLVARYWWRKRQIWNWSDELPGLVFVSVLATPYGAWIFDLVVLLVPVLAVAARLVEQPGRGRYLVAAGFALVTVGVVAPGTIKAWLTGSAEIGLHTFIWVSPAVLALCLWGNRLGRRSSHLPPVNLGDTPPPGGREKVVVRPGSGTANSP
ncbi:glycosyltransferase family 87 protein [Limnoglobus roseus]|uniref:DUF2029 domain-containing protein n=1 Tax=Limnoglobus roseus TaxID=2598579 RepID=A0A5C1A4C5_9BACT|nr:glycosyltransferase family 87 protein [Limnoglobus roseus]QEL13490.1 hypothetical protein PX52LOC_00347 [Limnoglobus roseus]